MKCSFWLLCVEAAIICGVSVQSQCDPGEPLHLTPYIQQGKIEEGRRASQVPPLLPGLESYSGFLTVNAKLGSNLFFWFFPAEHKPKEAPVVLWLQGGPGYSSLFATFKENGPFLLTPKGELRKKQYYWSQKVNMLYIDNPFGAGYSYTESEAGYVTNQEQIGRHLYACLLQFFQLFPEYSKNSFFVTGESYAGKYAPAVAMQIHKSNPTASHKINLQGLAIGNGWVDPFNMIDYANYFYSLSFIDEDTRDKFSKIEKQIKTLIQNGKYVQAFFLLDDYFGSNLTGYPSLVTNVTGVNSYYNILRAHQPPTTTENVVSTFLNADTTRKSLHVGKVPFYLDQWQLLRRMKADFVTSAAPKFEVLLENYRVLLYNGQLDIICAYPLTTNYVRKMKWSGASKYRAAKRKQWYVGNGLAGYVKSGGNLTRVLVRNAGHMVPADQPRYALDMITRFTNNVDFKVLDN